MGCTWGRCCLHAGHTLTGKSQSFLLLLQKFLHTAQLVVHRLHSFFPGAFLLVPSLFGLLVFLLPSLLGILVFLLPPLLGLSLFLLIPTQEDSFLLLPFALRPFLLSLEPVLKLSQLLAEGRDLHICHFWFDRRGRSHR